jgi:cytoskeletal protein CcmA (bactofilin family)
MAEKGDNERRNITVFGEETEFDGVLEFSDRLVITGKFSGKINAPSGDLEIAKNAACKVSTIDANSIIVAGGDVQGDMNAAERVEICSGSKVSGNITTARIRIANNVEFNGDVNMLEKEPDVDLFSVASSEYKQAMIIHSDVIK